MMDSQKSLFALDENVTYLNCAYMGPMLKEVVEIGKQSIGTKLNPADIIVDDTIILELKSVSMIVKAHEVQLVNYLVATNKPIGLLLNFGEKSVEVKRKIREITKEDRCDKRNIRVVTKDLVNPVKEQKYKPNPILYYNFF